MSQFSRDTQLQAPRKSGCCGSRRVCAHGYLGCRGGWRCRRNGHAQAGPSVEALIDSMTQMMRASFEEEREKARRESDGSRVEDEDSDKLPSYRQAVSAGERR
jgi:hypothetical protein